MKGQSSILSCFSQLSVCTLPYERGYAIPYERYTVIALIIYHAPPLINIHVHHPAENPGSAYVFVAMRGKGLREGGSGMFKVARSSVCMTLFSR